jgi:hypothetical protein
VGRPKLFQEPGFFQKKKLLGLILKTATKPILGVYPDIATEGTTISGTI